MFLLYGDFAAGECDAVLSCGDEEQHSEKYRQKCAKDEPKRVLCNKRPVFAYRVRHDSANVLRRVVAHKAEVHSEAEDEVERCAVGDVRAAKHLQCVEAAKPPVERIDAVDPRPREKPRQRKAFPVEIDE